VSIEDKQM